jgi:hypothetical protein
LFNRRNSEETDNCFFLKAHAHTHARTHTHVDKHLDVHGSIEIPIFRLAGAIGLFIEGRDLVIYACLSKQLE